MDRPLTCGVSSRLRGTGLAVLLSLLCALALSPAALAVAAATAQGECSIPHSWRIAGRAETRYTTTLFSPLLLDCQLLLVNNTNVGGNFQATIEGFDVATGKHAWSWFMTDGRSNSFFASLTPGQPLDHLITAVVQAGVYNISRLSHDSSSGLHAVWSTTGYVDFLQEMFEFPAGNASARSASLLLLQGSTSWVTLDASTGQELHHAKAISEQAELFVLGDGTAHRFVAVLQCNETETQVLAYQLSDDGRWQQLAASSYNPELYAPPQTVYDPRYSFPRQGEVMILQKYSTQPDHLYGLNLLTGRQTWSASGYPLLTGAWVDAYDNYTLPIRGSVIDAHPGNPNWALITASAQNSSGYVIYQFGLLDSITGQLLQVSAATQPEYYGATWEWFTQWHLTDDGAVLNRRLSGSTGQNWWLSLNATTLQAVSMGKFDAASYGYDQVLFVSAQPGSASIVVLNGTDNSVSGQRRTQEDAVTSSGSAPLQHLDRHASARTSRLERLRQ